MKSGLTFALLSLSLFVSAGCGSDEPQSTNWTPEEQSAHDQAAQKAEQGTAKKK